MATSARDRAHSVNRFSICSQGHPLVLTFEKVGKEWYCPVCGSWYDFLHPPMVDATDLLRRQWVALTEAYENDLVRRREEDRRTNPAEALRVKLDQLELPVLPRPCEACGGTGMLA